MLSPDSRAHRARRQAETPLSVLCRFPGPALSENIDYVPISFDDYKALARDRRDIAFDPAHPYKVL
jgi:hypothetical protein